MTRQYSLCGDRWDPFTYRVGVLREQAGRGGSAYVHDELEVGDLVGVGGPRNNFALVPSRAVPVRRRRHRHHPAAADGARRPSCSAPTGGCSTAAADAHVDGLPRRAGRRTATASRWCRRTSTACCDLPAFLGEPATRRADLLAAARPRCSRRWSGLRRLAARTRCAPSGSSPRSSARRCGRRRSRSSSPAPAPTVTVPPEMTVLDAVGRPASTCCPPAGRASAAPARRRSSTALPDHRDALLDDAERAAGDCMYICVSRASQRPPRPRPLSPSTGGLP